MFKKNIPVFLLLLIFSNQVFTNIAAAENPRFISSDIWYSKDPFVEGNKIKISAIVFNPEFPELTGVVSFFDNTTLLGKKEFKIKNGEAKALSVDWVVNAGSHAVFGRIEDAKFLKTNGVYEDAKLENNETDKSKRSVSKKLSISESPGVTTGTDQKFASLIVEKTPNMIANPIITSVNKIENFRTSIGESLADQNSKLRFLFIWPILFYGISILILFLMLRFIWRTFF